MVADEATLGLIEGLAGIGCTLSEVAELLCVSVPTFSRFLSSHKSEMGGEAPDPFERGKVKFKISLRRQQFALADKSATMAIFLGKQYLGQKDVVEVTNEVGPKLAGMSDAERQARITELAGRLGYVKIPEAPLPPAAPRSGRRHDSVP